MAKTEKKEIEIIWRKEKPGSLRAKLERNIERFESLYGMSSLRMLEILTAEEVDETDEILEWMQDFHVLRYLKGEIRTAGTRGTITTPSTTSD